MVWVIIILQKCKFFIFSEIPYHEEAWILEDNVIISGWIWINYWFNLVLVVRKVTSYTFSYVKLLCQQWLRKTIIVLILMNIADMVSGGRQSHLRPTKKDSFPPIMSPKLTPWKQKSEYLHLNNRLFSIHRLLFHDNYIKNTAII